MSSSEHLESCFLHSCLKPLWWSVDSSICLKPPHSFLTASSSSSPLCMCVRRHDSWSLPTVINDGGVAIALLLLFFTRGTEAWPDCLYAVSRKQPHMHAPSLSLLLSFSLSVSHPHSHINTLTEASSHAKPTHSPRRTDTLTGRLSYRHSQV